VVVVEIALEMKYLTLKSEEKVRAKAFFPKGMTLASESCYCEK
jgi:hypothetical protein